MSVPALKLALTLATALSLALAGAALAAETPKRGGVLNFVVPDEPPSWDGTSRWRRPRWTLLSTGGRRRPARQRQPSRALQFASTYLHP